MQEIVAAARDCAVEIEAGGVDERHYPPLPDYEDFCEVRGFRKVGRPVFRVTASSAASTPRRCPLYQPLARTLPFRSVRSKRLGTLCHYLKKG